MDLYESNLHLKLECSNYHMWLHNMSCRWQIQLPLIVSNSIRILSDGGLGMAMFSLGVNFTRKLKISI
jgi:hypothetical protein